MFYDSTTESSGSSSLVRAHAPVSLGSVVLSESHSSLASERSSLPPATEDEDTDHSRLSHSKSGLSLLMVTVFESIIFMQHWIIET